MMVLETNEQPIKRGRWRPRKNPLPETTAKDVVAKATPKKQSATKASVKKPAISWKKEVSQKTSSLKTLPEKRTFMSWEDELLASENRTNKSKLLSVVILLLWIALIAFWMYQKINQAEKQVPGSQGWQVDVRPDVVPSDNQWETPNTPVSGQPTPTGEVVRPALPANDTTNLIGKYFDLVNKWEIESYEELQDRSFQNLSALRTYFNQNRLETFVNNTIDGIHVSEFTEVSDDPALTRNSTAKAYDFVMSYALKDWTQYTDDWRAYTLVSWSGDDAQTLINGFVYQWPSASQSPFFQFGKYNIR